MVYSQSTFLRLHEEYFPEKSALRKQFRDDISFGAIAMASIYVAAFAAILFTRSAHTEPEPKILRLAPSSIPGIPSQVRSQLESRGCTIPQGSGTTSPNNVIQGSFTQTGKTEWAVLCSSGHASEIVVFWGDSFQKVSAFDFESESRCMENGAYARRIELSDKGPYRTQGIRDLCGKKVRLIHTLENGEHKSSHME